MDYIVSAATDVGLTKKTNQDSFGLKIIDSDIGKLVFAVLCDGMGGLSKGELASATVVKAFLKWITERLPVICSIGIDRDIIRSDWFELVNELNDRIGEYGREHGVSLGTTITALLLTEDKGYVLNVGDSRTYEIASDSVTILTRDQSLVAREVEMGVLTPEQAKTDPRRSVLLQCVGASDTVEPEIDEISVKRGAVYMLCSDGFIHEVTAEEIHGALKPEDMTDPDIMKKRLDYLIEENKNRQERDNISAVAIKTL